MAKNRPTSAISLEEAAMKSWEHAPGTWDVENAAVNIPVDSNRFMFCSYGEGGAGERHLQAKRGTHAHKLGGARLIAKTDEKSPVGVVRCSVRSYAGLAIGQERWRSLQPLRSCLVLRHTDHVDTAQKEWVGSENL